LDNPAAAGAAVTVTVTAAAPATAPAPRASSPYTATPSVSPLVACSTMSELKPADQLSGDGGGPPPSAAAMAGSSIWSASMSASMPICQ